MTAHKEASNLEKYLLYKFGVGDGNFRDITIHLRDFHGVEHKWYGFTNDREYEKHAAAVLRKQLRAMLSDE